MSIPNLDVYFCGDCEQHHCRTCDPPGKCKECGQELCIVCHAQSHQSDRRGLCNWCDYHQSGHADEEQVSSYERLMRMTPEQFAKQVAARGTPMPWPRRRKR